MLLCNSKRRLVCVSSHCKVELRVKVLPDKLEYVTAKFNYAAYPVISWCQRSWLLLAVVGGSNYLRTQGVLNK